jgi:single-stranded DNA-binding protein
MGLIKKENLIISIGEYQNKEGVIKQDWRTIGELITMQGKDGPYQFFKLWGASWVAEGKVVEQRDKAPQQQQSKQPQQAPQQSQRTQQAPVLDDLDDDFSDMNIPF